MNNTYDDVHSAYLRTLQDVFYKPDYICSPRGMKIRECVDYSFKVKNPVAEPIRTLDLERNKVIEEYSKKEMELYNSCSNRVEDFAKASKFWEKIANEDGTINSAYGYLIWKYKSHGRGNDMKTPWDYAKQCLIADKDTRQAILRFNLPEHAYTGNKDFPCTTHGNFLIRENKLHLSIVMRSNDVWLGLTYDLPWFVSLIDKMVEELKPTYPELTKGTYTHTAHSMHIYERDSEKVIKALGDI